MLREIAEKGIKIRYDLQYKNVKNINLRIKSDGGIYVSANRRVPQSVIDDFVSSKRDFILNALEKIKKNSEKPRRIYRTDTELAEMILEFCERIYPYYKARGIKYPQIKLRKMVSMWGSCHTQKGILTFNTNLIYAPTGCVEYVIYHEFTHFLVANHSSEFYAELEKVCPDWKMCRVRLREINIRNE